MSGLLVNRATDPVFESVEPESTSRWFEGRRKRRHATIVGLVVLLAIACAAAVSIGAVELSISQLLSILLQQVGIDSGVEFSKAQESVLLYIRLPRVLLGALVGATLGMSGAAIQGLFRNPLAEPMLIGTSGGAAMAAVIAIVFTGMLAGNSHPLLLLWIVPVMAFLGSLAMTWIIYTLSLTMGRVDVATMLLAGIAVNALAFAVIGLATFLANDSQLRTITFWSLGSVAGASWHSLAIAGVLVAVALLGLPTMARSMDALAMGESEAWHLGVNVDRVRRTTIVLVALSVGVSVALTGMIGFLGLVVPHLLRLIIGPDHRLLLPGSALLGASLLVAADLLARTLAEPAELPLGVVTAFLGAPYFLWILLKNKGRGGVL